MMDNSQKIYTVSGQEFDEMGLRSFCLEKISVLQTPYWERDIWSFILKFLSNDRHIEVKTSGSTGKPKTISLHKKHMIESAKTTNSFFGLKKGDMVLLCLPVQYIAGKMMIVRALVGGMDLQFIEPEMKPRLSSFDRISFTAMTPMQLANLLSETSSHQDINKIQKLILGGSGLPIGMLEKIQLLKTQVWQTYGMTETITHIALQKLNGNDAAERYQCFAGVKIDKGENDCLIINYPKIGVENLKTNDIVDIDNSGQFKVLGRIDNVVNSGGVKLFPEQIEKKLAVITEKAFFLTGIPDKILGEKLVMVVESTKPSKQEIDEMFQKVKEKVSTYEVPKEIIFSEKFERTLSGKIIRKEK